MIGIRIGRYKPSGLQDWEKILVGIAGLKNPIGNLFHFCQCETQTCGYFHCFGSEKSILPFESVNYARPFSVIVNPNVSF